MCIVAHVDSCLSTCSWHALLVILEKCRCQDKIPFFFSLTLSKISQVLMYCAITMINAWAGLLDMFTKCIGIRRLPALHCHPWHRDTLHCDHENGSMAEHAWPEGLQNRNSVYLLTCFLYVGCFCEWTGTKISIPCSDVYKLYIAVDAV